MAGMASAARADACRGPPPPSELEKAAPLSVTALDLQSDVESLASLLKRWAPNKPSVPKPTHASEATRNSRPLLLKARLRPFKKPFKRSRPQPATAPALPTLKGNVGSDSLYDMQYHDALLQGGVSGGVVGTPISELF
jgi:hypothetical protein